MPAALPKQPMTDQFPGHIKPLASRPGLYLRISPKGERVWSWWTGQFWCLYSNTKKRALEHADRFKRSKHQNLPWYGMVRFQTAS